MDGLYYRKHTAVDPSVYLIMDNDSGYVSNNLDQESNSDSILDNSHTSTVDILRSLLPKPVYLSEDALLECPDIRQNNEENALVDYHCDSYTENSPDIVIDSSIKSEEIYPILPSFNSFQTDSEVSESSVVPIADPIYFDLNTKIHSSPSNNSVNWERQNSEIQNICDSSANNANINLSPSFNSVDWKKHKSDIQSVDDTTQNNTEIHLISSISLMQFERQNSEIQNICGSSANNANINLSPSFNSVQWKKHNSDIQSVYDTTQNNTEINLISPISLMQFERQNSEIHGVYNTTENNTEIHSSSSINSLQWERQNSEIQNVCDSIGEQFFGFNESSREASAQIFNCAVGKLNNIDNCMEKKDNELSNKNPSEKEDSSTMQIPFAFIEPVVCSLAGEPSNAVASARSQAKESCEAVCGPISQEKGFSLTRSHSDINSSICTPTKKREQFFGFNESSRETSSQIFNCAVGKLNNIDNCIEEKDNELSNTNPSEKEDSSTMKIPFAFIEPVVCSLAGEPSNAVASARSQAKESCEAVCGPISQEKGFSQTRSHSDINSSICTPTKKHSSSNLESHVLLNVTNTCDKLTNPVETTSKVIMRRRANSSKDKENVLQPEVFKTPNKGLKRKFNESASPDLFDDDDECCKPQHLPSPKVIEERFVHKLDHKMLKSVQQKLSGVPPPPDLTITNFTVDEILEKLETNKSYFWGKDDLPGHRGENIEKANSKSLNEFKNSSFDSSSSILTEGSFEEAIRKDFPHILYFRHHGLHHNRNKLSEEIEHLCDKYAKRYVGAETQSTCCAVETKYMSPSRRKSIKSKWCSKSPGRRLSHLARRRITFSSANLQASCSSSAASRARQILIDYKKLELLNHKKSPRKSPRKTPRKSPKKSPSQGRTPSSSAKKKLRMRFRLLSGDFKEGAPGPSSSIVGSKRALFQSPDNENKFRNILSNSSTSSASSFNSDLNSRGTKRSLFSSPNRIGCRTSLFPSPNKKSPFKNVSSFEKKRKREMDDAMSNPSKYFRSQSTDLRTSENEQRSSSSFSKTKSDGVLPSSQVLVDLSAAHKKKLQWAVYESLKHQNITTSHPQFKTFASVLARVTRRFILTSNVRSEGGTSERMLRIARHHSFAVVRGKSVEEIMSEYNKNRAKTSKPQGYIAPEDYQRSQSKESSVNKENALKDRSNTGDSVKNLNSRPSVVKVESRIDRIRKVINFEDNR